jgi:hypothetical protein
MFPFQIYYNLKPKIPIPKEIKNLTKLIRKRDNMGYTENPKCFKCDCDLAVFINGLRLCPICGRPG